MCDRKGTHPPSKAPLAPGKRDSSSVPRPLALAAALARGADRVLTACLSIVLALILLYAGYALWDTWRIYESAGVDPSLLKYKPARDAQEDDQGFVELRALNPEIQAWLTVEETNIDYPVVQGQDNIKYVNTDIYGEFSLSGSIFLDYRNAGDFTDPYSLLYGHHMDGDVMFGELKHFTDAKYFETYDAAWLYTLEQSYYVELFACLETDAYDAQVFSPGDYTQEKVKGLLERLRNEACQYREIGVCEEDRILALSTCSDASTNARTIVFGRLIEAKATTGGGLEE